MYIDDVSQYCHKHVPSAVQEWNISEAEITLNADDVALHTKNWPELQMWMDACSRWVHKKWMKWESANCAIICDTEEEIVRDKLRFHIGRGKIKKVLEAPDLGMSLTRKGLSQRRNQERWLTVLSKVRTIAGATKLDSNSPFDVTRKVLETYLRSMYLFNRTLLDDIN